MAIAISYGDRLKIVSLRKQGVSFGQIAQQLSYSRDGVQKIWQRYETGGYEGLKTLYHKSGRTSPYEDIKLLVGLEKTDDQGAPYIRSVLCSLHPDKAIPHERTIQRWWEKSRGKKKGSGQLPTTD